MSRLKRSLLVASSTFTMLVVAALGASATPGGSAVLRAAGATAALAADSPVVDSQAGGAMATGPGVGPIQIFVGDTWFVQDKVGISGQVTVTCGPFVPGTQFQGSLNVSLSQASGKQVAHAFAFLDTLVCDGVPRTYGVTAVASNLVFKNGGAVAQASAFTCGQGLPGSFLFCVDGQATAPIEIRKQ